MRTNSIHNVEFDAVTPFILDVRLVDSPAGVTQGEGHAEFLHLPSAVLALTSIA